MPVLTKQSQAIDINTIADKIDNCVISFFSSYNIDIYNLEQCRKVPHNTVNLCFRYIYKQLFKPSCKQISNKHSIIDYEDIELITILADKFLEICQAFNKSLGLMSFSFMTGIDYKTIYNWMSPEGEKLNPKRFQVLIYIQEGHKAAQIGLLNDSPVGALAVANNDQETGLNWSANQAAQITNNTVYLLPSERSGKLKHDKLEE